MLRLKIITVALLLAFSGAAHGVERKAHERTRELLTSAWPYSDARALDETGRGVGIVFSPDLSVRGNCRFYQALGFACFEDTDWTRVLDGIRRWNLEHADEPIRTLLLETHGTNGNGLKLQKSYDPKAERSYISVGALQERVEADGVRFILISACNSGRLLRPSIYNALDRFNGDKLFLPATCGILDASPGWSAERSRVTVVTPASSHIESTLVADVSELPRTTRRILTESAQRRGTPAPAKFAISDMLMEIITRDDSLRLMTRAHVDEISREMTSVEHSERLFRQLKDWMVAVTSRPASGSGAVAAAAR